MKTVIKMLNVGSLLALVVVASPAISIDQAHAYSCKGVQHQGAVVKQTKIGAKLEARKDWQARMKTKYGLSWSTWSIAANKSVTCHKTSDNKNLCIASASPCNYVVQ